MKQLFIIATLLLPLSLWAQGHELQLAPKIGIAQWSGQDVTSKVGPVVGLDMHYIHRWPVTEEIQLGLRTGLGLNYTSSQLSGSYTRRFSQWDYMGNTINYTAVVNASEQHKQFLVDIPVMASLLSHHISANLGCKLLWFAADNYTQTVERALVDAYYPRYGVYVFNETPTGMLATPYTQTGKNSLPQLSLALSADVGYEWSLGYIGRKAYEHFVGVQLFLDWGIWNIVEPVQRNYQVVVDAITAPKQTPQVMVGSVAEASNLHYFSIGVRGYYTIDFQSHRKSRHHR